MHPITWLVAAVVAAILLKRYGRKLPPEFHPRWDRKGRIRLGKDKNGNPFVACCPERIVARRRDRVKWEVEDPKQTGADVWLKDFEQETSAKRKIWKGPDEKRRGKKEIVDVIADDAEPGLYTYRVYLNSVETADPEIEIKG